jgi:divalent metal cation (Fe/Co/Zn/Cd) transporter
LALSSDPVSRAVFAEDAVAVLGNVIALAGIALHQATGSAVPDAAAAILIALTLAFVAYDLARRNRDFIIGRQAAPPIRQQIRDIICAQQGIISAPELIVTFLGPRRVWVVGRVNLAEEMMSTQVKEVLHNAEAELRKQSPYIARVDLTPSAG